jgi:hypothetical protein
MTSKGLLSLTAPRFMLPNNLEIFVFLYTRQVPFLCKVYTLSESNYSLQFSIHNDMNQELTRRLLSINLVNASTRRNSNRTTFNPHRRRGSIVDRTTPTTKQCECFITKARTAYNFPPAERPLPVAPPRLLTSYTKIIFPSADLHLVCIINLFHQSF